jgi:two-component system chemotaxis response regulator CheB
MPRRDIIVIGTSAGGVNALRQIAAALPPGFPASTFVVCQLPAGMRSALLEISSRSGPLLALHPRDGETFDPGHIYVAPPDHHMPLAPESRIRLNREARENQHRPAIDPLFRSAARYYGPRVLAIILTGALIDGRSGLLAVRASGGMAVVQDPDDAPVASMPQNATEIAGADHLVPPARIASLLVELVNSNGEPEMGDRTVDPIERTPNLVDHDMDGQARDRRHGAVSVFACPECGGALWQVDESEMLRFRCLVGHAYIAELLLADQSERLETGMWTAVRIFRERSALSRQLANRERRTGKTDSALRFDEQARQSESYSSAIRDFLLTGGVFGEGPGALHGVRPETGRGGGDERTPTR